MSTQITLIIWYRAVSVLSLFVTLPLPPLSLFRDFSPLRLEICVLLRTGGSFCVVSALMFALLRAFDLTGAWSQTRNFTWHPSNLRQKVRCFHVVSFLLFCDSCVSISVVIELSLAYCVGTPRAFINTPSYIYIDLLRWHNTCLIYIWRCFCQVC